MDDSEATSLEQVRAFLAGSGEVRFAGQKRAEVYGWTERTLVRFEYAGLGKRDKGLVRPYVARMTGLSWAQLTRLIASYTSRGRVKAASYQRPITADCPQPGHCRGSHSLSKSPGLHPCAGHGIKTITGAKAMPRNRYPSKAIDSAAPPSLLSIRI